MPETETLVCSSCECVQTGPIEDLCDSGWATWRPTSQRRSVRWLCPNHAPITEG